MQVFICCFETGSKLLQMGLDLTKAQHEVQILKGPPLQVWGYSLCVYSPSLQASLTTHRRAPERKNLP